MLQEKTTDEFAGQVVTDVAATISGVLTNIGHKIGLYKAMAGAGDLSSSELARKTNADERYVREWLNNQTAGGYVHFNQEQDTYHMPDSHIPVLADEESPFFLVPALEVASSLWHDEEKLLDIDPELSEPTPDTNLAELFSSDEYCNQFQDIGFNLSNIESDNVNLEDLQIEVDL